MNQNRLLTILHQKQRWKQKVIHFDLKNICTFFVLWLALPRLYERLCEEKADNGNGDEPDSNHIMKLQHSAISGEEI